MTKAVAERALSRRQLLKAIGAGGAVLAAAPVLAACGSSSPSSSSSTTSSGGGGGTTSSVQDILKFIGPIDPKTSGKGMTFDVGAVLAFSGAGAFFGRTMSSGMKVAATHIEALGGPKLNLIFKDHKSGDPQAGVNAARELGTSGVPMMLASYVDDLAAMLPLQAQYKIFTLDGGGGTSLFAQGKPYFWGTRAITPDDTYPGVVKYISQNMKNVKRVTTVEWDLGPLNTVIEQDQKKWLTTIGVTDGGHERVQIGATDYSTAIQRVKADGPDIVFLSVYGNDIGNFMKQYAASGINKPVLTFEYTQPSADLAGSAYEGLNLAFDYFNAKKPDNGWSKIFIDEFRKANSADPDFYAANYYEDTFALWECIRRVLAKNGNPKDGVQLNQALMDKLEFPSVYGGTDTTPGTLALSPTTHSVTKRPMTWSVYQNGQVVPKAYFDIGGADYRSA